MRFVVPCVASLITMSIATAEDWPQWMGVQRDNVWRETGIINQFPDDGPKLNRAERRRREKLAKKRRRR